MMVVERRVLAWKEARRLRRPAPPLLEQDNSRERAERRAITTIIILGSLGWGLAAWWAL